MLWLLMSLLLGVVSTVSAGVAFPLQQNVETHSSDTCSCIAAATVTRFVEKARNVRRAPASTCAPQTTVYRTVTVSDPPPTVTVAVIDEASISSYFAAASTVDSLIALESYQDRPISAKPDTNTALYTYTALASVIEASEWPATGGSSVYYFSRTGYPAIAATTVVTILPYPQPTRISQHDGTVSNWNGTNSTAVGDQSSSARSTKTIISYISTVTVVVNITSLTTASPTIGTGYYGYGGSSASTHEKRQTCELIYAQINGHWASWCNNWDGSKTLTYTSWETTVTNANVPGASPPPESVLNPSSTSPSSMAAQDISTVTMTKPTTTVTSTRQMTTTTSTQPATSSCGQVGEFVIDFDDLPQFSTTTNDTTSPPIFNPFEHFFWSIGWGYGPPPNEPFPAHNGSRLAEFNPHSVSENTNSPDAGLLSLGTFGAGPRNYNDIYWFDAHSAWVGCNNTATIKCDFVATAYQYDQNIKNDTVFATQHFAIPACSQHCQLTQISFDPSQFTSLSALSVYANVGGNIQGFFVDTLDLSWWNNTCAAGLTRISSRK